MSAYLTTEMQCEEISDTTHDEAQGYTTEAEATVRISNPASENGAEQEPGPLSWLNSARITTDPGDDAIHYVLSLGDPRGGFCFTVRRLKDGRLLIHTPHPGEGMAHMETRDLLPGTLEIGQWVPIDSYPAGWHDLPHEYRNRGAAKGLEQFKPTDFSDPTPEWLETVNSLPRERCVTILEGFYFSSYDEEGDVESLREEVTRLIEAGNIDPDTLESD